MRAGGDTMSFTHHVGRLADALAGVDVERFNALVELLDSARDWRGRVYVSGNGGSAAVASHFAGDALKACNLPTVCLSDNATAVTAIANDHAYADTIARQLRVLARTGDILLLFSCSGASPNILAAMQAAHDIGMTLCVVFGERGRDKAELVDVAVIIPSNDYGVIEDAMSAICHAAIKELNGGGA